MGKSLCHAWGASPIYLLGRYFAGIQPIRPGYETFLVDPKLDSFHQLTCIFPVKGGWVKIEKTDTCLTICTNRDGGILRIDGKKSSQCFANQPVSYEVVKRSKLDSSKERKKAMNSDRLKVSEKLGFALTNLGNIPIMTLLNTYLLIFYTDVIGVNPALVGMLFPCFETFRWR